MTTSINEQKLARLLLLLRAEIGPAMPPYEVQYQFCPGRRWLFDVAFPSVMLAIEADGRTAVAKGGRHNASCDREKTNAAALLGWTVFRLDAEMLAAESYCLALLRAHFTGGQVSRTAVLSETRFRGGTARRVPRAIP